VGAAQKIFAWKIGIGLSGLMLLLIVILNTYSIFTGLSCLFCLIFLFFESAFGICLGCLVYGWFNRKELKNCAGDICEIKEKQEIQKTSGRQVLILLSFVAFIILMVFMFADSFGKQPGSLWKL
jgi:hypothetical protein